MNAEIRAVQRRERHIAHRLKSIAFDARRLEGKLGMLEDALEDLDSSKLRFLANERCGSWYLPSKSYFRRRHQLDDGAGEDSAHKAGTANTSMPPNSPTTCYFKSSDGHYGQWAFSTSRLNLAVVKPLLRSETSPELHEASIEPSSTGSVTVIVDATQHGKAYPDSFSKTIPMWARVMNEAYFRNIDADAASPPSLLPPWLHPSETNSIAQRLPSFVSAFCAVCPPSLAPDVVHLEHPLTIVWLHGEDDDASWRKAADSVQLLSHNHHVLVLVCASGDATWGAAAKEGDLPPARHGWTYVRGAADDHQSWGMGLTCEIFWEHVDALTDPALSLDDVEESVEQIVKETISGQQASDAFTHSVDDTRKVLTNVLQRAVLISNDISVPAVQLCAVVGVERPSPLPHHSSIPPRLLTIAML
ncbi:initiator tRNA phosphoribosyl transferase, putative [Bodo saltans]|uniref:Initiator tRNA phosphoribosyl transferase, putative n=1 Tax=Bodo saltans TaxID=75058 RepID=A0A0S4IPS8_BODSA|nr:initiator tRNA phosphoribosyl transferase, putative [Bodo saltans]|eukprot:CUF13110.1 initiator tRNA phosphoribosyl transferase, putative [Bodo saltans]